MDKVEFINNLKKKYTYKDIIKYLDGLNDLEVLCVGDTIYDVYQYGHTLGKSGKAPIVAFKNEKIEQYDGGILAIKNHLNDFCGVRFYTGDISIVKKRYIQNEQKLFETYSDIEDDYWCWQSNTEDNLENIEDYDMVLVADFGHGLLTKDLREKITDNVKYISLNCQMNAGNMGMNTINKYEKADYVCIDQNELRLTTSNQYEPIEDIIRDTFSNDITAAITLFDEGCIIYKNDKIIRIPAFIDKRDVIDTVGAGDIFLSITSLLAYSDAPPEIIGFIGNCAGGFACLYPGNKKYLTKDGLYRYIREIYG